MSPSHANPDYTNRSKTPNHHEVRNITVTPVEERDAPYRRPVIVTIPQGNNSTTTLDLNAEEALALARALRAAVAPDTAPQGIPVIQTLDFETYHRLFEPDNESRAAFVNWLGDKRATGHQPQNGAPS